MLLGFNHIIKTGGMSLDYALYQSYKRYSRIDLDCEIYSSEKIINRLNNSDCIVFHASNSDFIKIVLFSLIQKLKSNQAKLITIIREPISRIESSWNQQYKTDYMTGAIGCPADKQPKDIYDSLDSYLEFLLENYNSEIMLSQLRQLCLMVQVDDVLKFIENNYLAVGIFENYDSFFALLQSLKIINPNLQIPKLNSSQINSKIRSNKIRKRLEEIYKLDIELYNYFAQQKFWLNHAIDYSNQK